jgi:hypothetical protein
MSTPQEFKRRLDIVHGYWDTPCWCWQMSRRNGYGQAVFNGKIIYAHRLAYELFKGPIPDGMEIDHLCKITICCNPDHLRLLTKEENIRGSRNSNRFKPSCSKGHLFSKHGYIRKLPNGLNRRVCRICNIEAGRKFRRENKD